MIASSSLADLFNASLLLSVGCGTINNLISASEIGTSSAGIEDEEEYCRKVIEDDRDCDEEILKQKCEVSRRAIGVTITGCGNPDYQITEFIHREGTGRKTIEQGAQAAIIPLSEALSSLTMLTRYHTIQRTFRCFLARKELRTRRQQHLNQVRFKERQHHLATCCTQIQRLIRGHLTRMKYKAAHEEKAILVAEAAKLSAAEVLAKVKSGDIKDYEDLIFQNCSEFFSLAYSSEGGFELGIVEYHISRGWDDLLPHLIDLLVAGLTESHQKSSQQEISAEIISKLNKFILHAAGLGRQVAVGLLCEAVKVEVQKLRPSPRSRSRQQAEMYKNRPTLVARRALEVPHPDTQYHWLYGSEIDQSMITKKQEVVLLLCDIYGSSIIMERDAGGGSSVHYSLVGGIFDMFDFLVSKMNRNPNDQDASNRTPLHYAAAFCTRECALETIVSFSNVLQIDALDMCHNTPLHYAARRSHIPDFDVKVVKTLLRLGASPSKTNINKLTPVDISRHYNNSQLTNSLLYYEPLSKQGQPLNIPSNLFGKRSAGKASQLMSAVTRSRIEEERLKRVAKKADSIKINEGGFSNKKFDVTYRDLVEMLCKKNGVAVPRFMVSPKAVVPSVDSRLSLITKIAIEDGYLGLKHVLIISSVVQRCPSVTCLSVRNLALRPQYLASLLSSLTCSCVSELDLSGNTIAPPAVNALVALASANLSKLLINKTHKISLTAIRQIEESLLSRSGSLTLTDS